MKKDADTLFRFLLRQALQNPLTDQNPADRIAHSDSGCRQDSERFVNVDIKVSWHKLIKHEFILYSIRISLAPGTVSGLLQEPL